MIIDSSALVAIIRREPEAHEFKDRLATSGRSRMSAATYLETGLVLKGAPPHGQLDLLDELVARSGIEIEPFTMEQARWALIAFQRFGKGNHPARLNFGDCISYALAAQTGEPLLFKGQDFARTDIPSALD